MMEASAVSLKSIEPTDDLVDLDNVEESISDLTSRFKQEQTESKVENEAVKQEPAAPKNQTTTVQVVQSEKKEEEPESPPEKPKTAVNLEQESTSES